MNYWLLKTEPDNYSYADLERDGATTWDGVANNTALMHIRTMQPGDLALIYHTGDERQLPHGVAPLVSLRPYPPVGAGCRALTTSSRHTLVLARPRRVGGLA